MHSPIISWKGELLPSPILICVSYKRDNFRLMFFRSTEFLVNCHGEMACPGGLHSQNGDSRLVHVHSPMLYDTERIAIRIMFAYLHA